MGKCFSHQNCAFRATPRRAIKATVLQLSKGKTLKIDKGTCIFPNPFPVTTDLKIWGPDAKEFNPDRFLSENNPNRHPFASFLFGGGRRICPGKNLAIYQTKDTLIYLIREFKFEFGDEAKVTVKK